MAGNLKEFKQIEMFIHLSHLDVTEQNRTGPPHTASLHMNASHVFLRKNKISLCDFKTASERNMSVKLVEVKFTRCSDRDES